MEVNLTFTIPKWLEKTVTVLKYTSLGFSFPYEDTNYYIDKKGFYCLSTYETKQGDTSEVKIYDDVSLAEFIDMCNLISDDLINQMNATITASLCCIKRKE